MLTETWAAAYFQSLIMILIFTLGVPALIIQMVAPSAGLSRLVHGRFRLTGIAWLVLIGATVITVSFAWWPHPAKEALGLGKLVYANALMTAAIALAAGAWVVYLRRFTRAGVIRRIQRAVADGREVEQPNRSGIEQDSEARRRESGERNLGILGEASRAGHEKREILDTIDALLVARVSKPGYDGTRCRGLLGAARRTLLTPGNVGNDEDFRRCVEILLTSRRRILELNSGALASCSDLWSHTSLMADVACTAAAAGFQATQDLLEHLPPEKLLEVGVAAWRAGQVPTYTYAVSKLGSLHHAARSGDPQQIEHANYHLALLVCLLAHLFSGGPAARHWSSQRLEALRGALGGAELEKAVDRAWEDRITVGDFDSADAVHALRESLKGTPQAPTKRRSRG